MSAEIVRAACPHDCPDTCGMLVTVEDGVATKIQGDPSMPFTDGTLCTKVAYYLERTYSPDRLLYPMRRVGPKGKGQFERITWDAALDEIAARLKALAAENPETILPCSYAGTMGMVQYSSMDRRFFHKLGASLLDRTLCSTAGKFGLKATLGGSVGMDPERFDESKLILLWGANPIVSNLHLWSRVQEAKRRGAKVIAIDPYRSLSAEKCSQHIALLPGTDGALALGMMHVLIAEGMLDRDYLAKHPVGFEPLAQRVKRYTPDWAAQTCGITREEVVQLAREYGGIRPAAIRLNYGMQRHAGGGIAARTIACLPALVGAWRDAPGGIVLSTADFYGFDHAALERADLLAGRRPRVINQSQLGDALTTAQPPVRAAHGLRRAVLPRLRRGHLPHRACLVERGYARHRMERAQESRLAKARAAGALYPLRRGRVSDGFGQMRVLQRVAGEAGRRPAAVLQPAGRGARRRHGARALVPARLHLAAGATFPQFVVCQPGAVPGVRARAAPRQASPRR